MSAIFLCIGYFIGVAFGYPLAGIIIFLIIAGGVSYLSYYYSDVIVLLAYNARIINKNENLKLHALVEDVAKETKISKPKIAIISSSTPNAFATGRDKNNAVLVFTEGILELLDDDELKGVICHEIAHIKNRDTLVMCLAATIGTAIGWSSWTLIYNRDRMMNPLFLILLIIMAPVIALLIHMSISRSREFYADEISAKITKNPKALASALEKIEYINKKSPMEGNPATSPLFIVNPFRGGFFVSLFSTHPPTEDRILKLHEMKIRN